MLWLLVRNGLRGVRCFRTKDNGASNEAWQSFRTRQDSSLGNYDA